MPELPDVTVYVEALQQRIVGQTLLHVRLASPFLLRTVEPGISEFEGKDVVEVRRVGKRIVIEVADELFIVVHLMIAGRFKWLPSGSKIPGKLGLAAFDFSNGTLLLTEAGSKRRASLHLVRGEAGVKALDPGGAEVLDIDLETFRSLITRERHTQADADRSAPLQRNRQRLLG
jgi:formamidopyrimidine-DNA glycosylase